MTRAAGLSVAGFNPARFHTTARVHVASARSDHAHDWPRPARCAGRVTGWLPTYSPEMAKRLAELAQDIRA
jgi:hypothetical protein